MSGVDLSRFSITKDSGYAELAYVDEGEEEGEFVRFVEPGDTLAELVSAAERFVPMVDSGGENGDK